MAILALYSFDDTPDSSDFSFTLEAPQAKYDQPVLRAADPVSLMNFISSSYSPLADVPCDVP